MNLLPPLHLMEKWRGEGLTPEQVRARAAAWVAPDPKQKPVKAARPRREKTPRRRKPAKVEAPVTTSQPAEPAPARQPAPIQSGRTPDGRRRAKPIPAPFFPFPAPAGLGYRCDGIHLNPESSPDAPRFIHCQQVAIYRLIIRDERRARNVKRCEDCASDLRLKVLVGAADFEIELDQCLRRK